MRLAMWSGPRNLSTAMMYAFGNRPDFHVVDEPFYGPFLRATGRADPMRDAILAARPEDGRAVQKALLGPVPDGKRHAYHKHMCQHMVPELPRDVLAGSVNVFLLRHPARVVASFLKGFPEATREDLGFDAQIALFDACCAAGQTPVVIDSHDIRRDPERALRVLCDAVGLPFDPAMLRWPAGPKPFDGIWAAHWYGSVHSSTGFAGPEGPLPRLSARAASLCAAVMPAYRAMAERRLRL
ncbi:HAD family hydrolase [Cognatishimia sp. F0-27]|uniref:sulfotransferase-like domain-containing protein n=1 Tax=Cognatishimia sp. F0-27 TaxID=2816855 RepID=UPI001D0C7F0D|nr:HAD family hydrolase [Cognatishimia sp. F0-27]MCC1492466.1 HAD family hydrolase [Cognatishimia sp. F0-27]